MAGGKRSIVKQYAGPRAAARAFRGPRKLLLSAVRHFATEIYLGEALLQFRFFFFLRIFPPFFILSPFSLALSSPSFSISANFFLTRVKLSPLPRPDMLYDGTAGTVKKKETCQLQYHCRPRSGFALHSPKRKIDSMRSTHPRGHPPEARAVARATFTRSEQFLRVHTSTSDVFPVSLFPPTTCVFILPPRRSISHGSSSRREHGRFDGKPHIISPEKIPSIIHFPWAGARSTFHLIFARFPLQTFLVRGFCLVSEISACCNNIFVFNDISS